MFTPFETDLWLTLLISLFGTVVLLWLFEGANDEQDAHGNCGKRRRNMSKVSFGTSFGGERVVDGEGGGEGCSASRARSAILYKMSSSLSFSVLARVDLVKAHGK